MSKPAPTPTVISYSIARKDSGYFITRHKNENGKVTSEKLTEPNALAIAMSQLEMFIRKQHGV